MTITVGAFDDEDEDDEVPSDRLRLVEADEAMTGASDATGRETFDGERSC